MVWHLLEEDFELALANPQHIRNVPGRKADVSDAGWIADLLAQGLIRSSFLPRHNQALIALARRRCDVLFAMLRHGTFYHPVTPQGCLTGT